MWQTEPGRVLAFELGELGLVIERSSSWVRCTVHRHRDSPDATSSTLIASGNTDTVHAAIKAAENMHGGVRDDMGEKPGQP